MVFGYIGCFGLPQLLVLALLGYLGYKVYKKELTAKTAILILIGLYVTLQFPTLAILLAIIALVVLLLKKGTGKLKTTLREWLKEDETENQE